MSNETKGAGLPGSTAREPAGDTASRAVKQAVEETKQTGGTGAALGPQAKSQPAQPR